MSNTILNIVFVVQIETMENFFKADGLSRIIFYFQEVENLPDAGIFLESF